MTRSIAFCTLVLLLSSCCKRKVTNDLFTNDELDWLVYNHDSNVTYIDNFGNIDTLVVTNKFIGNANLWHEGPGCKINNPAQADIVLQVDTNVLSIHLYKNSKSSDGLIKSVRALDIGTHLTPNGQNVLFSDSIFINSIWQRDVYTITYSDTINYPNRKCLRFYFSKNKGFLKLNLRNGITVTRQ